jgi:hypothetical protein
MVTCIDTLRLYTHYCKIMVNQQHQLCVATLRVIYSGSTNYYGNLQDLQQNVQHSTLHYSSTYNTNYIVHVQNISSSHPFIWQ